ncbi:MAG: hypothetical protein ACYCW7_15610 [Pseudomonadaceae bacterium]
MSRVDDFKTYLESLDEDARAKILATTQGQIYLLTEAVSQQARRLRKSHSVTHTEHQADAVLFVYALLGTLQLASLAAEIAKPKDAAQIEAAISAFGSSVPQSRNARDILAHLDEYIAGFGKLQTASDEPLLPWFSRSGEVYVVRVGTFEIDVDSAENAAIGLATVILLLTPGPRKGRRLGR